MKYFNKPRVGLHNIHPSLEFWAKTKEVQGDVSRCAYCLVPSVPSPIA